MALAYIVAATVLVSLVSLVGVLALRMREQSLKLLIFFASSFSAGTLLAGAFLDLLPESLEIAGSEKAFPIALLGVVAFFVLEKFILWHHHHSPHKNLREVKRSEVLPLGYLSLLGDGLHNFFDGIAIAAAFITSVPLGITTTFIVMMHEIPQELGDFGLLLYSGFSRKTAAAFNLASGLLAVLGGAIFYYFSSQAQDLEGLGLAFTSGMFIYIAAADIVPELHKEKEAKKSALQLAFVLLGIGLIWMVVRFFE